MPKRRLTGASVKVMSQAAAETDTTMTNSTAPAARYSPAFCSGFAFSAGVSGAPNLASPPGRQSGRQRRSNTGPIMIEDIDQSLAGARQLRARLVAGDVDGAEKRG